MRLKVVCFVPGCVCGFAAAMGILFAGSSIQAATYYWTTQAGAMSPGNGVWDTAPSATNWSTSTTRRRHAFRMVEQPRQRR